MAPINFLFTIFFLVISIGCGVKDTSLKPRDVTSTQIDIENKEPGNFKSIPNVNLESERLDAKNGLENYIYSILSVLDQPNFGPLIEVADSNAILNELNATILWLRQNPDAKKEEFELKQKEAVFLCDPIMTKVYQSLGNEVTNFNWPTFCESCDYITPTSPTPTPIPDAPKVEEVD